MDDGYTIKVCICWKNAVIRDYPIDYLMFPTEQAALRHAAVMESGPALARTAQHVRDSLQEMIGEEIHGEARLDTLVGAYGSLGLALRGVKRGRDV